MQRGKQSSSELTGPRRTVGSAPVHLRNGKPVVRRGRKAMGPKRVARLPKRLSGFHLPCWDPSSSYHRTGPLQQPGTSEEEKRNPCVASENTSSSSACRSH